VFEQCLRRVALTTRKPSFHLAEAKIHTQGSLVTLVCFRWRFLLLGGAAAALGCTGTAPAATAAPPPPVHAVTVGLEAATPISEATAEILANWESNLRSETAGRVVEISVEAGDRVEEGQILLRLDVGRPASAAQAANAAVA
jgi:multidrug efflux pump subunit AcrA (membrane-fusion protein)